MKKKTLGIITLLIGLLAIIAIVLLVLFYNGTAEVGNKLNVAWYDENGTEFTISTADELYEFAELSNYYNFKDQTIKLGADIVVNEGNAEDWAETAPARRWVPISGFAGVFDGQGHTISGIYAKGFDTPVALFSGVTSSCVIQNFRLVNSYFTSDGYGGTGSVSSEGGGNYKQIYSDAIIETKGQYVGGIVGKVSLKATFEECWFDGKIETSDKGVGGILGGATGAHVTMEHCLFSGEITQNYNDGGTKSGGLCGILINAGASLIINDSLASGELISENIYYTGSILGVLHASTALKVTNTYASLDTYATSIGRAGDIGNISSKPFEIAKKDITDENAYKWTNLNFDEYWAIVKEETPILQCFADTIISTDGIERGFNLDWYNENGKEYIIMDAKDLYGLHVLSNTTDFAGKTIKLGADIVVNEGSASDWEKDIANTPSNPWYPIQNFAGTFDGQGHSISGIYINTAASLQGLFGETTAVATIKNLRLLNSFYEYTGGGNVMMGGIAGRGNGLYENIYTDIIIRTNGQTTGGIIGQVNADDKNTIRNCWFDGKIHTYDTGRYAGGIVSNMVRGDNLIEHCLNTGLFVNETVDTGIHIGGLVGVAMNSFCKLTMNDCLSAGSIDTAYDICVGSVFGRITSSAEVVIKNTYATTESYQHPSDGFRGIGNNSISTKSGSVIAYMTSVLTGTSAYQWTTLDFDHYWAAQLKDTPVLKQFATNIPSLVGVKKQVDISWYKEDAKVMTINSVADLHGFYIMSAQDSFEGKTVKLGKDLVINSGNAADWENHAPAYNWNPIVNFKGTFDGQGHTISGIYLETDATYVGLFSQTLPGSTVKNLRVENSYFKNTSTYMAAMGSIAGQMGGTLDTVYSNAILESSSGHLGGLVGRVNHSAFAEYKITNCWFDGEVHVSMETAETAYIGGLAGGLIQGYLYMDNCLNTGEVTYMYDKLPLSSDGGVWYIGVHTGGLVGGIMNGRVYDDDGTLKRVSEWHLSDSLNAGLVTSGLKDGSQKANGMGSIFGYTTRGTVNMENVYATTESCTRTTHYNSGLATVTGSVLTYAEDAISGMGGYQYTVLDFSKYWSARKAEVPALKSFAGNGLDTSGAWRLDNSWYDENEDSFVIETISEFYGFANLVNSGTTFEGKTVTLGKSINLNKGWTKGAEVPENIWNPIGQEKTPFKGTFDGNGKTICGLYINSSNPYVGLFGYAINGKIKNFTLTNSYITGTKTSAIGAIVGNGDGVISGIYCDDTVTIYDTDAGMVAGIIARIQDKTNANYKQNTNLAISNCWFDGNIVQTYDMNSSTIGGGLAGYLVHGTATIDNCLFTGAITHTLTTMDTSRYAYVGGIHGRSNANCTLTVEDCMSAGTLAVTASGNQVRIGAVIGWGDNGVTESCTNSYATSDAFGYDRASLSATVMEAERYYGIKGYQVTTLNFDEYWSAQEGKVPALKTFVGDGLDLTGVAKQDTSWYDGQDAPEGTAEDPYILTDMADLYGFAKLVNGGNSFEGKTVKLSNDIDLNAGWTASATKPTNVWEPIGSVTNTTTKAGYSFRGTFDGGGKTIRGIYINETNTTAGFFGHTRNSVIKNLRIENSYMKSSFPVLGSFVGYGEGDFINLYSNAILESSADQVGGIIGRVQDTSANGTSESFTATNVNMTSCWFDGDISSTLADQSFLGGLIGAAIYGTVNVNNSVFTGDIVCAAGSLRNAGLVGCENGASATDINITNSVSAGTLTGTTDAASVIWRVSNTTNVAESVYASSSYGLSAYSVSLGSASTVANNVKPTTVNFEADGVLATVIATLNTNATANSWEAWAAYNGKPVIKSFVKVEKVDVTADTSWITDYAGTEADPYILEDAGDLYGLANLVNGGNPFAGKYFELAADIAINHGNAKDWAIIGPDNVWTPIGTVTNANSKVGPHFAGVFDGKNKSISGIYIANATSTAGLFGHTRNSVIKNLRIENSYLKSSFQALGSFVGYGEGDFINLYSNAILESSVDQVGGIIGRVQDTSVNGTSESFTATNVNMISCWFDGDISSTLADQSFLGGLIGVAIYGTVNVNNSVFTGDIVCEAGSLRNAGLVGCENGASATDINIINSVSAGTLTGTTDAGSVIWRVSNTTDVSESVYVSSSYGLGVYSVSLGTASTVANNVKPTIVDFAADGVLTSTITALNKNAALNDLGSWVSYKGKPVIESLISEE